jgi:hypothetical protein
MHSGQPTTAATSPPTDEKGLIMTTTATATATADPTIATAAQTIRDGIAGLKAKATETLGEEFQAIAEAARTTDVSLRLERHNTMSDLVGTVAWLAGDLVDVLHKVAAGTEPHSVMRSDLARRIHEAEVRLELLRELSR